MSGWAIFVWAIFAIWFFTKMLPKLIESFKQDMREREEDRQTHKLWGRLESLGYQMGRDQMPPQLPNHLEDSLDPFAKMAFMGAWKRGFEEAQKPNKRRRS